MRQGIPYDSPEAVAHLRLDHRDHARRGVCHLGGDRQGPRPLPRLRPEPRAHAAGDTQPPPGGVQCGALGVRGPHHQAAGHRSLALPGQPGAGGARDVGPRPHPRGDTRLPECPGHRARAHRHHRAGDGLRHHRDRARLRPREVQEAGGRRLLQDHQPEHPAGAALAGLPPRAIDDIVAYCVGRKTLRGAPYINPDTLRAKGFDEEGAGPRGGELEGAFDLTFAFNAWTLGEGYVQRAARHQRGPAGGAGTSICCARSGSPRRRSRRPTTTSAAP